MMKGIRKHSRRDVICEMSGILLSLGTGEVALGQGYCRDGYGQSRCPLSKEVATAAIGPVLPPTNWRTTALDHILFELEDYRSEAAFYVALLGWKIRSDDGREAVLDIGDWGSAVFRQVSPAGYMVKPPTGRRISVSSFAFVIEPWNARRVASELRNRGLTPVVENRGRFESFHVRDPDGWNLQICNAHGLVSARRTTRHIAPTPSLPFGPTGWQTVWLDHMSFRVSDYKKSASFYSNLLGWKPSYDEGSQNELLIGDVGDILVRNSEPTVLGAPPPAPGALLDHISFGISPWDVDSVRAALISRGLPARVDTSSVHVGPDGKYLADDIHQAAFQSYHTVTPNGFNLQISWMTRDKRLALATAVKPKALLPTN
jgi:catechol 2,3-dioxygenase-like lactoylglutathione lyase family enzyme